MVRTKEARFEARLEPDDNALLTWAAEFTSTTKRAFVLGSALERARASLAGEELTQIARSDADGFLTWLERPVRTIRRMKKLAGTEPFE